MSRRRTRCPISLTRSEAGFPTESLSLGELIRAIRLDLAAEEEAVHIYTAHAEATDNALAKRVLLDIADEERVHAGEFSRLLSILTEGEEDRPSPRARRR